MSVHKQFQPIRSSRFAGYKQHIYIFTNVLFNYIEDIYIFVERILYFSKDNLFDWFEYWKIGK